MGTALQIENLHKIFKSEFLHRKKAILKGISLSVSEGEVFGYLGPNGAGKTTTLKCLLGLIFPDKGRITILGEPHLSLRAKARLGFLPENPYFYDYLTAEEFLRFYSQLFLLPKDVREKRIRNRLEQVGLKSAAKIQLRKFSRGMLQRIGLAQALLNDPELVFLDEPLGGLDPLGRKEIRDIINGLKREGKTVFLCSHILQDIEMICDRVGIIVDGRLINQGRLQDLISEKILHTEIVCSGVSSEKLAAWGEVHSSKGGKTWLKIYEETEVERFLAALHADKGKVHSLIPRTETLEDIFVEMVKPE